MSNGLDRVYLDRISSKTDFLRDPLEKVYRLLELLGNIVYAPDIQDKLLLKGGTSLQFIYLGYRRLSVDIDFNYIGSVEKLIMEADRELIRKMLVRIFNEHGYVLEKNINHYAEEQFILAYTNCVGNRDRIKVEINYLERMPILPVIHKPVKHPFDGMQLQQIPTFQYIEVIAQKTRALITRATARDLFDVYLIAQNSMPFDSVLYRKMVLFYLALTSEDLRKITPELISDITKNSIKRHLAPMLKRREYEPYLEDMKQTCLKLLEPIFVFTREEQEFLDYFYEKKIFKQELLFGDTGLKLDLGKHPGIRWRLNNI